MKYDSKEEFIKETIEKGIEISFDHHAWLREAGYDEGAFELILCALAYDYFEQRGEMEFVDSVTELILRNLDLGSTFGKTHFYPSKIAKSFVLGHRLGNMLKDVPDKDDEAAIMKVGQLVKECIGRKCEHANEAAYILGKAVINVYEAVTNGADKLINVGRASQYVIRTKEAFKDMPDLFIKNDRGIYEEKPSVAIFGQLGREKAEELYGIFKAKCRKKIKAANLSDLPYKDKAAWDLVIDEMKKLSENTFDLIWYQLHLKMEGVFHGVTKEERIKLVAGSVFDELWDEIEVKENDAEKNNLWFISADNKVAFDEVRQGSPAVAEMLKAMDEVIDAERDEEFAKARAILESKIIEFESPAVKKALKFLMEERYSIEYIKNKEEEDDDDYCDTKFESMVTMGRELTDIDDIYLSPEVKAEVDDFCNSYKRRAEIKAAGLKWSNKLLLAGPPGNGKPTLAGAIAKIMGRKFYKADFGGLRGRHIGETGNNISKLFRELKKKGDEKFLLFLDECDAVATKRVYTYGADKEDSGALDVLLRCIDDMPEEAILLAATNFPDELDGAFSRRFNGQFFLPLPDDEEVDKYIADYQLKRNVTFSETDLEKLGDLYGNPWSKVEEFCQNVHKHIVLGNSHVANAGWVGRDKDKKRRMGFDVWTDLKK